MTPPWSKRQRGCAGLKRQFYPAHLRDLVDYDYADSLPESDKIWLAAFTEEHYRGWRLKAESQVLPIEQIRAAKARDERARISAVARLRVTPEESAQAHCLPAPAPTADVLIDAIDRAADWWPAVAPRPRPTRRRKTAQ